MQLIKLQVNIPSVFLLPLPRFNSWSLTSFLPQYFFLIFHFSIIGHVYKTSAYLLEEFHEVNNFVFFLNSRNSSVLKNNSTPVVIDFLLNYFPNVFFYL